MREHRARRLGDVALAPVVAPEDVAERGLAASPHRVVEADVTDRLVGAGEADRPHVTHRLGLEQRARRVLVRARRPVPVPQRLGVAVRSVQRPRVVGHQRTQPQSLGQQLHGRSLLHRVARTTQIRAEMTSLAGSRIVVADNDPEWLELIALDLSLEGHEIVARAASGLEALACCDEHQPEVLVVDYRMPPGMNGVEVAERVRDAHPDVAVVVFSNYEDPVMIAAAEAAGATFVLKTNMRALRKAVAGA